MARLLETVQTNVQSLFAELGRKTEKPDLDKAKEIVEHLRKGVILFYGEQEVQVGLTNIDWSGKHVEHQEWTAQLNRFNWFAQAAALYEATKDESIAQIARSIVEDWINQHTYSSTSGLSHGDNTLNISIRIGQSTKGGWWASVGSFAGSKAFDDAFVQRMVESTAGQMDCLRANIAGEMNWRISHLDSLIFCGLTVPGLDKHTVWSLRQLSEAFLRQINEDGSHEEHCPNSYHGWMTRVFTAYWRLNNSRPELGLKIQTDKILRMWDYYVHATAPDGGSGGVHDGPRWEKGTGTIASLKERASVIEDAKLTGDASVDLHRQPARYFNNAGQLYMRDRWDDPASMWASFDTTRWGGSHDHLSRNAISLYANGRMLLCDPGIFSYASADPFSAYGKSTPAHNTINFDGMNQCEANPDVTHVATFDDLSVINSVYEGGYYPGELTWGFHEGHRPGLYGQHARTMVYLGGRGVVVFDTVMVDREGQRIASHWQLQLGEYEADLKAGKVWSRGDESNVLVQVLGCIDEVKTRVYVGQHRPQRGWLPMNHFGKREPAPQIAHEFAPQHRWGHLETLLLPFTGSTPPDVKSTPFNCDRGRTRGYVIGWGGDEDTVIAAAPNLRYQVGDTPHLSTDASLAVVHRKAGKPTSATLIDGTYLQIESNMLINEPTGGNHRWQTQK